MSLPVQITKVPENLLPFAIRCRDLTVSNTRTVLLTPEIYVNQNVYEQLVDLMLEALRGAGKFVARPASADGLVAALCSRILLLFQKNFEEKLSYLQLVFHRR